MNVVHPRGRVVFVFATVALLATLVTGTVIAAASPSSETSVATSGSNSSIVMVIGLALMAAGTCLIVGLGRRSR